jgi:hypothetical protein
MGSNKTLAMLLVLVLVISSASLLMIKSVNAESTDNFNHALDVISPNNSTTYNDTMPLNFTIDWSVDAPISWMNLNFSYSIDGSIERHDLEGSLVNWGGFPVVTTSVTSGFVDITNLTNGRHKLTILATGFYDFDSDFIYPYNYSFDPIDFQVLHNTPNSTSPSQIAPIMVVSISIIAIAVFALLLYRWHRKTMQGTDGIV